MSPCAAHRPLLLPAHVVRWPPTRQGFRFAPRKSIAGRFLAGGISFLHGREPNRDKAVGWRDLWPLIPMKAWRVDGGLDPLSLTAAPSTGLDKISGYRVLPQADPTVDGRCRLWRAAPFPMRPLLAPRTHTPHIHRAWWSVTGHRDGPSPPFFFFFVRRDAPRPSHQIDKRSRRTILHPLMALAQCGAWTRPPLPRLWAVIFCERHLSAQASSRPREQSDHIVARGRA